LILQRLIRSKANAVHRQLFATRSSYQVSNQDQRFASDQLIDLITIARGVVASEFGGF